ncbi:MAG TPA: agmatinase family protein [Candidatus Paceibacterota bacterium]|nr:agmatinase family protein [Candidatus Paceibacterota bacterium]
MDNKEKNKILEEKISSFDPNDSGSLYHGVFGLPFNVEESKMVLVPVPWEATVSYGEGTLEGPKAILDASQQIDLFDPINPTGWKNGIAMMDIPSSIFYQSKQVREKTNKYLEGYNDKNIDKELQAQINADCAEINKYVKETTLKFLNEDKIVGVVGGEHSVPLGYLEALSEKYNDFGILHFDAHMDLRDAYLGLEFSHASIFFNALKIKNISKLVSVGIRDFCEQEYNLTQKEKSRISVFTDYDIKKDIFKGETFKHKVKEIISKLPKNVYVSFDIDALIPYLSPGTGTPVIGGLTVDEVVFLIEELIASGRKIIGFDLCEVAKGKDEWDGNVGARVLYKLCLLTLKSQK